jgi:hypothetical protein
VQDWQLTATHPLALHFAADCRLTRTDYTNDQAWGIALGSGEEPALSIQTQYGGRVGIARLIPMWVFEDRVIYEQTGYAESFTLRYIAPNYAKLTARLTPTLAVTFELWVMDSHAVGGRFQLSNQGAEFVALRLDFIPQVARDGKFLNTLKLMSSETGQDLLTFGQIGLIAPVLILEGAHHSAAAQSSTPKLTAPISLNPGEHAAFRWVHAAHRLLPESVGAAHQWAFKTDWDANLNLIEQVNANLPIVQTGNTELDATLSFTAQATLRSFLSASGKLPYPSPVGARIPGRGNGGQSGTNHPADWLGQSADLAWLVAPSAAWFSPDLARGMIRNFLAVREKDGWVDGRPGLGGQRVNWLAMPLIASAAWAVYEVTEDKHFLSEVYNGLHEFYLRWFARDMDRDGDGAPEWTSLIQAQQEEHPVFNRFRRTSTNAEISRAETPDLLTILIHEGESLLKIQSILGRSNGGLVESKLANLRVHLADLWDETHGLYRNRDRDSHATPHGQVIYRGKGDEWLNEPTPIGTPHRVLCRIVGGQAHAPNITAIFEGLNAKGDPIRESIPAAGMVWYAGMGTLITEQLYTQLNYVKIEGLSRVFMVELDTLDLTREALTNFTPIWAGAPDEHATILIHSLRTRYLKAAGLPFTLESDLPPDHPNRHAPLFWNALILDALLDRGELKIARELLEMLLGAEITSLKVRHAFHGPYHADTGEGQGNPDDLNGLVPFHLFMKFVGIRMINSRRVWAGGAYPLDEPLTITQHGVTVVRSAEGTTVRFPSGSEQTVDGTWQVIEDSVATVMLPPPQPPPTPLPIKAPPPLELPPDLPPGWLPESPSDTPPITYKIPVIRRKSDEE